MAFIFLSRLTDDQARENWEKYGDPNGPQGTRDAVCFVVLFSLMKQSSKVALS